MFLDTNPHAPSWAWNDIGSVQRTVTTPALAWTATPATSDWNTAGNWNTGAVPTAADAPQFGPSTITTVDIKQASTQVGGLTLKSGAPAYTFNITGSGSGPASLIVGGAAGNETHPFVAGERIATLRYEELRAWIAEGRVGSPSLSFKGSTSALNLATSIDAFLAYSVILSACSWAALRISVLRKSQNLPCSAEQRAATAPFIAFS